MSQNVTNSDTPDGMDPRKREVAERYAAGESVAGLSALLGVTERTVYRLLKDQEVMAHIGEIRRAVVGSVIGSLTNRLQRIADQLDTLCQDAQDERTRLAACRVSSELTLKLMAFQEYDQRLRMVEDRLGMTQGQESVNA